MLVTSQFRFLRVSRLRVLGLAAAALLVADVAPAQLRGGGGRSVRSGGTPSIGLRTGGAIRSRSSSTAKGGGAAIGLTAPRGISSGGATRTRAPTGVRPRSVSTAVGVLGSSYYYSGPYAYTGPWAPWVYNRNFDYAVHPSSKSKRYPPPVAFEPRLGLQNNYPFAWQMGLQMPAVSDPLYTYSLGPFRGVVGSPQEPRWLDGAGDGWGLDLMKAGKFKAAGKLLAKGFRDTDDPRYPLVLVEALFALGKFDHAELVLRHALALEGAFDHLPEDVASHFSSAEVYASKLKALVDSAAGAKKASGHELLLGYLQTHATDGTAGLTTLLELSKASGDGDAKKGGDELAAKLYRHYLGKAFGGDEEK